MEKHGKFSSNTHHICFSDQFTVNLIIFTCDLLSHLLIPATFKSWELVTMKQNRKYNSFFRENRGPSHQSNHSMVAIIIMTCCDLGNVVHIIKHNELFVLSQCYPCKLVALNPLVSVIYTDTKQTSNFLLEFGNYVPLWPWKLRQDYQNLISSFYIRIQFSFAS